MFVGIFEPALNGWTTGAPATSPGLCICEMEVAGLKDVALSEAFFMPPVGFKDVPVAFFFDELETLRAATAAGDATLNGMRADVGLTVITVSMQVSLKSFSHRVAAYLGRPKRR